MADLQQDVWLPGLEGEFFRHGVYFISVSRANWLGQPIPVKIKVTSDKYSNFHMSWDKASNAVWVEGSVEDGEEVPLLILSEFVTAIAQERHKA